MIFHLSHPLLIASNLHPAVRVGDHWLTLNITGRDPEGRLTTHCEIYGPGCTVYNGEGPSSGVGAVASDEELRELFASAIAFLMHDGECYRYSGNPDYCWDAAVAEWADEHENFLDELYSDLGRL